MPTEIVVASMMAVAIAYLVLRFYRKALKLYVLVNRLEIKINNSTMQHLRLEELAKNNFELSEKQINYDKKLDLFLYRQIESYTELSNLLGFYLSGLRGWALSPDAGVLLYKSILNNKPKCVLELGGGLSTVIIAAALRKNGTGKLISVDHDIKYATSTKKNIDERGLGEYCDIRVAPIRVYGDNKKVDWYDIDVIKPGLDKIDYLVVDGPPGGTTKDARQPAVELLGSLLSKKVVVFIDDYSREDERKAVDFWLKQLNNHKLTSYDTEKGTAILRVE